MGRRTRSSITPEHHQPDQDDGTLPEEWGGLEPDRWIERHAPAMFAYARLRLPSADLAEEAVQEALASAWRSRASFAGRSSERSWLIGVLRYKVLDLLGARRRAASGGGDPAVLTDDSSFRNGQFATRQDSWAHSPDDKEMRRAVREALEDLPETMRHAVVLREIDGLSGRQVCEILGVSETNLWTLVHRGKARLRASLAERFGGEHDSRE